MRRALAFLGTLGALEVLGLSGPKISLGARGTMFRQPRRRYRPGMRNSELIKRHGDPLPNGIQLYTPKGGPCKSGGGCGLGNKAEARWDSLCNILSYYNENDPVFEYPEAAELKEEAIWRKRNQPQRREYGFYAAIVPGEYHTGLRLAPPYQKQQDSYKTLRQLPPRRRRRSLLPEPIEALVQVRIREFVPRPGHVQNFGDRRRVGDERVDGLGDDRAEGVAPVRAPRVVHEHSTRVDETAVAERLERPLRHLPRGQHRAAGPGPAAMQRLR